MSNQENSFLLAAMSERQRFYVELKEGEVTMISWKKLVANAERFSSGPAAQKGLLAIDLPVSTLTLLLFGYPVNISFGYPDTYFLDDAKSLPCFPLRIM